MFNIATIEPSISQLTTSPFRWGWDSNHWEPWMFHFPIWALWMNLPLIQMKLKNPPSSLSGSNTSANRLKIFYKSLIPSKSSAMINIGFHISFMWDTKFGCTCRKNASQGPIGSFIHSIMYLIPSPRLWVTMLFISTFPPSLAYTQY
jgi:hypothetical protein